MSTDAINRTITDKDGVEVVVGPEKDRTMFRWQIGVRHIVPPRILSRTFLADAHNGTTPQNAENQDVLPAQGFVPPSNHFGEDLTLEDRDLADLRTQLIVIADTTTPTTMGAVSVPLDDMDYDPEEVAGDVIPDRDQPEDSGGGEEIPPEGGEGEGEGEVPPETRQDEPDRLLSNDHGETTEPPL